MIGAFNTVYGALKGFFSGGFWFASFLPVAMVSALHALVATYAIGPVTVFGISLHLDKAISVADLGAGGIAIVVILVVAGYVVTPLLPLFRGWLDGSLLPEVLHDWLRARRLMDARASLDLKQRYLDDLGALAKLKAELDKDGSGTVRHAYASAKAHLTAADVNENTNAKNALATLESAIFSSMPLSAVAEAAKSAVIAALAKNNPDPEELTKLRGASAPTDAELAVAKETNDISDRYEDLISWGAQEATYRYQIFQTRNRLVGALEKPSATQLGDARLVVERYSKDVYQVDFNFLWPRLLVAIKAEKADAPILEAIENARAQVDFAVMSLFLLASIPAVWLPVILIQHGPIWLFVAIGIASPLVLKFFYELAFEGQLAFGDVVRIAIDRSRLLVLRMMSQADPVSRSEERRAWTRIAQAEEDGSTTDLIYVSPRPPV